jgi:hypothetical protein
MAAPRRQEVFTMAEQKKEQNTTATPEDKRDVNSGWPQTDSGAGRTDVTGTTNVYPASGPLPPDGARVQQMGSWGQGERGGQGYNDSGSSEIIPNERLQKDEFDFEEESPKK